MASVSGLSGFDSASLVDQLMQLERAPQQRLQSRASNEQLQVNSLQTLNSKIASLVTKAEAAADLTKWEGRTATSTDSKITVTAGTTASPGSLSIEVIGTALSHQVGFATAAKTTDVVAGGSIQLNGRAIGVGGGTLQEVADALNKPENDTGVRASLVRNGEDQYHLLVESTATGEDSAFTLTGLDEAVVGASTTRIGQDAELDLGAGITVKSSTNTFTDLLPGVTVTVAANASSDSANPTTSTITVARDTAGATKLVKDLVDGLNSVLSEMTSLTAYGTGTGGTGKGMLAGDATVRSVQADLRGTAFGSSTSESLAKYGIQIDRYGKFTFDEPAFGKAYAADPAGVAAGISSGFATRVETTADAASNKDTGLLTASITGRKAGIERLNDSVEAWDLRLELRRTALSRQFTALETALSTMNSQSSWLASQISALGSSAS
ncbi:flagellar filament capping protein FliD [Nocardioides deserti]|uniref:Flagellar hook-associated protein 2 n=1 Tax=Nocardioides deserti TaxID=1588644 RepID=A0ABR6UDA5_9ACTN|nr:flagellar filament capping protein FliD [Nocardioides deserti]MBC2962434.1 flagellar filament capping protein FliD [Nocardioides deserti]GGO78007.1 flagellar hook-associated protein 2 [Nocardioides deserti]